MTKLREQILAEHQLTKHLASLGVKGRGQGTTRTTTRCAGTQHKDGHFCVSVDTEKQLWHCHDCKTGGSIIDWLMIERNQTAAQVMKSLAPNSKFLPPEPEPVSTPENPRIAALYDYVNESGEMVYQAVRLDPKSFRQRRPDGKGGWLWNMEGVTRILYNLPAVINAKSVAIAEGEKDCGTLESFGHVATCNVGGAGKWHAAYSERLKGKDVLIFPDMDEPGRKHGDAILASLDGIANSVKVILMPSPYKDVTDFAESFPDKEVARLQIELLISKTAHALKPLPIYSIAEMEDIYREHARRVAEFTFDLGKFHPDFSKYVAPLVPGEMLLILADTGVGKTAILQSLIRTAAPLPALMFELELPLTLLFERMVQQEINCTRGEIQNEYRDFDNPHWKTYSGLHHVMVCPESSLTIDQIEKYIERSELKFDRKPVIVAIDYVGLIQTKGARSRYEAMSNAAEELKRLAKRTQTILLVASQIARPGDKESLEVGLHDAKDSGSLECSAGIVLGCWRPERSRLLMKVLKATSGEAGQVIEARMNGATMRITA